MPSPKAVIQNKYSLQVASDWYLVTVKRKGPGTRVNSSLFELQLPLHVDFQQFQPSVTDTQNLTYQLENNGVQETLVI